MNIHPDFRAYFEEVAKKLRLLGQESGMINLFFAEGPDMANTLAVALRNKLTLPCLMIEFYDQDSENGDSAFQVLRSAVIVLDKVDKAVGHDDVELAIYGRCKPAAEQIFARMKKQSDRMNLKVDGKTTMLTGSSAGNWVGPLNSELYGWRIEFTWRIAAGTCYDPQAWTD